MPNRAAILLRTAAIAGLLALAACGSGNDNNLAEMDNSLIGNGADPALTSALEDQILVDPNLVQQTHPNSARPPETPVQAQYPADSAPGGSEREHPSRTRSTKLIASISPVSVSRMPKRVASILVQ